MVGVPVFYCDDPSSNPDGAYSSYSVKIVWKERKFTKEAGDGTLKHWNIFSIISQSSQNIFLSIKDVVERSSTETVQRLYGGYCETRSIIYPFLELRNWCHRNCQRAKKHQTKWTLFCSGPAFGEILECLLLRLLYTFAS